MRSHAGSLEPLPDLFIRPHEDLGLIRVFLRTENSNVICYCNNIILICFYLLMFCQPLNIFLPNSDRDHTEKSYFRKCGVNLTAAQQ